MINEIIQGVAVKLSDTFDGYKIYQNNVEQGFTTPCFFVEPVKPTISPLAQGRYLSRNPLDIHYFPTEGRNNAEMFRVAEELTECLEYINLSDGELLRGTSVSYEMVDGVLHFFTNYDLILYRTAEKSPAMGDLTASVERKE